MNVSETQTRGAAPAQTALNAARDELLRDCSRRRTARIEEIAADENRIISLKNQARLAAESGERQASIEHMATAASIANGLPLKRRSLESLDEERGRVVAGNHPDLATLSTRSMMEANQAAARVHQDAQDAFQRALAASGIVAAARALVEACKGLQRRPPVIATAIANASEQGEGA